MYIGIIGAGAVGSALGALLQREAHDVILIGRRNQVDAITRNGLRVDGCLGEFTAHMEAAEEFDLRPDVALLAVKTQDVVSALRQHREHLVGVPLVMLQNGVRNDEIAAGLVPRSQIISAVLAGFTANYFASGYVTIVQRGWLVLGRPFGPRDADVEELAREFDQVVPTRVSDNIKGPHWSKLILNLNNALPALTEWPIPRIAKDPYLSHLAVVMMREGLRVARQAGIALEPLPGMAPGLFRALDRLPLGLAVRLYRIQARRWDSPWPLIGSTLQSILRRRPTEIDYLNGEIVRMGAMVGMPTPLNSAVVNLVHTVERTEKFLSVGEIREAVEEKLAHPAGGEQPLAHSA